MMPGYYCSGFRQLKFDQIIGALRKDTRGEKNTPFFFAKELEYFIITEKHMDFPLELVSFAKSIFWG